MLYAVIFIRKTAEIKVPNVCLLNEILSAFQRLIYHFIGSTIPLTVGHSMPIMPYGDANQRGVATGCCSFGAVRT